MTSKKNSLWNFPYMDGIDEMDHSVNRPDKCIGGNASKTCFRIKNVDCPGLPLAQNYVRYLHTLLHNYIFSLDVVRSTRPPSALETRLAAGRLQCTPPHNND